MTKSLFSPTLSPHVLDGILMKTRRCMLVNAIGNREDAQQQFSIKTRISTAAMSIILMVLMSSAWADIINGASFVGVWAIRVLDCAHLPAATRVFEMSMDRQNPPASTARKEILTFVIPATEEGEKERNALVPLPKTYNEAVTSAIRVLGDYVGDASAENIRLRCRVQNKEKKWIWADIDPENWQLLVSAGDDVGVFEKLKIPRGMDLFLHGQVYLVFGERQPRQLVWSEVVPNNSRQGPHKEMLVRRPSSFTDAMQLLRAAISLRSFGDYVRDIDHRHFKDWTDEDWARATPKIKFYTFINPNLSTAVFRQLPELAYTNDDVWRFAVSMPGEVLGVVVPKQEEL
ncbi:hypothetical protein D9757_010313 [Collybiopsis confluens]|uniref:Uncharacterized protein n=1 Tax=Collybiopsis confluens TaxID=2823264 RepID=A0A8H5GTN9_9AGAR|nr:hypothetical protein D9757_010313 [Collybiopsis confluens]